MDEIRKLIEKALEESDEIDSFSDIEGEPNTIGASLLDGTMIFIVLQEA